MRIFPVLGVAVVLVSSIRAQRDMGPVLAAQLGGMIGSNTWSSTSTGPLGESRTYSKQAGFGPIAPPAAGAPDFRFASMFPFAGPGGVRPIHVDAITTGRDWIHADPAHNGRMSVPSDTWVAALFSVERGTGATSTGVVGQEATQPDGAGADVFSFAMATLPTFPPPFQRVTQRVLDSTELDLYQPGHQGELADFDLAMSSYQLDPLIVSNIAPPDFVFFTLTTTDAMLNPATVPYAPPDAWWGAPYPANRSGATILFMRWTGTAWTPPRVAFTHATLGLANPNEDIDSLAMENKGAGNWDIVYSTRPPTAAASQLMFIALGGGPAQLPTASAYSDDGGVPIADQLNIGDGNIDGWCLYDPSFGQAGTSAANNLEAYITGTPEDYLIPGFSRDLDASVWRTRPGGVPSLSVLVTGWTPGAGPGIGSDLVIVMAGFHQRNAAGGWNLIGNPLILPILPTSLRTTTDRLSYDIPVDGLPALTSDWFVGFRVFSTPFPSLASISQAYPVKIRL